MTDLTIQLRDDSEARALFGKCDETLRKVEKAYGVTTVYRNGELRLNSLDTHGLEVAHKALLEMLSVVRSGGQLTPRDIDYALKNPDISMKLTDIFMDKIEVFSKRGHVTPRSEGQKRYVDAIKKNDIAFGIGPAGTGKTYLAMAMAVNALKKGLVSRIILTRPAVEAGESLGFLPGGLEEKVNPYLRPLYDALYDMVDPHTIKAYLEEGVIEVAPLAYMRGRTLNNSFIILDEAQNSTPEQMKMFLTRLGFDSKTVITGDVTQSDLPRGRKSGLTHVLTLLRNIEGIKFIILKEEDVVRHELVQKIITAYREETEGEKND